MVDRLFADPETFASDLNLTGGRVIAVTDLTGDGRVDVLLGSGGGRDRNADQLILLRQTSSGDLVKGNPEATGPLPAMHSPIARIGDFNGDGRPDVALVDFGFKDFSLPDDDPAFNNFIGQPSYLLLSTEAGLFARKLVERDVHAKDLAMADVDGDGDVDLVVESDGGFPVQRSLLLLNDGDGSFTAAPENTDGVFPGQFSVNANDLADVNGDGAPDLIVGPEREVGGNEASRGQVVLNDGSGTFKDTESVTLPLPAFNDGFVVASAVDHTDINHDGLQDILVAVSRQILAGQAGQGPDDPTLDGTGRYLQLLVNRGNGEFEDQTLLRIGPQDGTAPVTSSDALNFNAAEPAQQLFRDINNDGHIDIFLRTLQPNAVTNPIIYLNDGRGRFDALPQEALSDGREGDLVNPFLVDYDSDGILDLVSSFTDTGPDTTFGTEDDTVVVQVAKGIQPFPAGSDNSFLPDIGDPALRVARLYEAAFDRNPDPEGLNFWVGRIEEGVNFNMISADFIGSPEFKVNFGENLSDSAFVEVIYENVLDRSPDASGRSYWLNRLDGELSRAELLARFSDSEENNDEFSSTSDDGVWGV